MNGHSSCPSMLTLVSDPIDVASLLSHAHGLARHSSAPVSSLLTPIDKAQYQPWPTENAMRQGLLFQMEGSMSNVGQTGQIGDGESIRGSASYSYCSSLSSGRKANPVQKRLSQKTSSCEMRASGLRYTAKIMEDATIPKQSSRWISIQIRTTIEACP